MVLTSTILVALVAGAFAGPVSRGGNTCAISSCPSTSKFDLETGKTYEYDYTTDLKTMMVGASDQESTLRMTATVHIEVLDKCELAIKLTDVDMLNDVNGGSSVDDVELLRQRVQQYPTRFAWVDGKIERVCQEEDEHVMSVNIKRGILSSLQNSMTSFDMPEEITEIDISGRCPVHYERTSNGFRTDTITKVKDMLQCVDGHRQNSHFHGLPYHAESNVQTLPLVKSDSKCDQEISGNVITKVVCEEKHVFRPFSTETSGATTEVRTELVQKRVRDGTSTRTGPIAVHDYLTYDLTPSYEELDAHFRKAKEVLELICSSNPEDVRPDVPSYFLQLVDEMQMLDATNLNQLNRRAKSNDMCDKALQAFLDAIPFVKSKDSIMTMRQLIERGEVEGMMAEFWLNSLAFFPHPTVDTLRESYALLNLNDPKLARKAYLGCSSMVNNYCKLNDDCRDEDIVNEIIKTFEDNLNYNCLSPNHEVVVRSLKSLANTGVAERSIDIINRCVSNDDEQMPVEFRVEAVKVFRRMSCDVDRSELMTVYRNKVLDSELRIHAYLQLMKCASPELVQTIHDQLKQEEVNQVGSFVWTHLTNLMESSDPLRQSIGEIIMDEELSRSFDLDKRKFSRNLEFSVFSEMLNAGATLDSNIIFSEKSPLPRSADLNMTLNLFGQQINMLETGARVEGLEVLLQQLMHGDVMPQQQRNQGNNDISVLDARYHAEVPQAFDANMYIRMFGNEIRYEDLHDLDFEALKDKINFLNFVTSLAEEKNYVINKNSLFMAASHTIPTMAGLPLKLTTQGAFSLRLKVHGKVDFMNLFSDPSKLDIHGGIEPSVAVEIQSMMGIDAVVAKTGLMMTETLHSSTVLSGKIEFEQNKIINVEWDMPREKMELLDVKSKFYIQQRGQKQELRMTFDDVIRREQCADLEKSMGVKICYEAFIPISNNDEHPAFPFTGPTSIELYVQKQDTFDKYHMQATVEHQTKPNGSPKLSRGRFLFDTPGSRVNRKMEWTGEINYQAMTAEMNLDTPLGRIQWNGDVTNRDDLKEANLVMMVEGQDKYAISAKLPIKTRRQQITIEPEIIIEWPGIEPPRITGEIKYNAGRNVEFDLRMRNVFSEPAKIEGEWSVTTQNRKMKTELELKLQSPVLAAEYKNVIEELAQGYSNHQELKYTDSDGVDQVLTLTSKVKDTGNNRITQYKLESAWTSTLAPRFNGDLSLETGLGSKAINIDFNAGFDGKPERLVFKKALSYELGEIEKMILGEFVVTIPFKNIDHAYGLTYSQNSDELNFRSSAKMNDFYHGLAEYSGKIESRSPLQLSSNIKLHYPGRQIEFEDTLQETDRNVYAHNARLQWRPNYVITADSNIKVGDMIDVDMTLNIPEQDPISVDIQIRPTLADFMLHAKAEVDGQDYIVDATMTVGGDDMEMHTHTEVEITYPGRHIKGVEDYTYNRGVIEGNSNIMWDMDNDMTKQSTLVYKIHLLKANPLFEMKMDWPENSIELNLEANIGPMMYDASMTLSCDLPMYWVAGEYHVGLMFKPKEQGAEMTVECRMNDKSFKTDVDLMLSRSWNEHHLKIDVETPFRGFRQVKLETKHEMTSKSLDFEILTKYEENEVKLVCENKARWNQGLYESNIVFTSPYEGLEDIRMNIEHRVRYPMYTTIVELTLPSGDVIKYTEELILQTGVKYSLDATLETPWEDYEELKLKLKLEMDDVKYTTTNELQWAPNRKIMMTGELAVMSLYEFMMKMHVNTPFNTMETFGIEMSNVRESGLWKPRFELEYMPEQKISMIGEMDLLHGKRMMIKITAPQISWFGTVELDYVMTGELLRHEMTLHLLMDRVSSQPMLLTTKTDLMSFDDMSAELTMTSPIIVRDLHITFTHQARRRVYTTQLIFTVPDYQAKFDNELRIVRLDDMSMTTMATLDGTVYKMTSAISSTQSGVDVSCILELPYEDYDRLGFTVHYTGSPSNFEANLNVMYGMGREMQCECKYRATDTELEVDAKILGIFTKDLTLVINHSGSFFQSMTTTANFRYGPSTMVQQQQVRQQRRQRGRDSNTMFAQLIEMMDRELVITFEHEGNIQTFNSKLEIDLDGQNCVFDLTFGLRGREIGGALEISTPFDNMRHFKIQMEHTGTWNDFSNTMTWDLNDRPYTLTNVFKYVARRNELEFECTVTTPLEGYDTLRIKWAHNGNMRRFNGNGELQVADDVSTIVFSMETGDNIRAELDVTSPLEGMQEVKVILTHNSQDWFDFTTDLDVTIDGRNYDAQLTFKWDDSGLVVDSMLSLPRRRNYGLSVNHHGVLDDFNSEVKITIPRGDIEGSVMYKNQGFEDGIDFEVEVKTPFNIMPQLKVKFMHKGLPMDFETRLETMLPFESLTDFAVIAKHVGGMDQFENSLTCIYNQKEIKIEGTFKMNQRKIEGKLALTTPYRGYQRMGVEVTHNYLEAGFRSEAKLWTPFENLRDQSIEFKFKGPLTSLEIECKVKTDMPGFEEFNGKVECNMTPNLITASIQVQTPFEGYETVELTLTHRGMLSDFQTMAVMQKGVNSAIKAELKHKHTDGIDSQLLLETPWEFLNKFSVVFKQTPRPDGFDVLLEVMTPFEDFEDQSFTLSFTNDESLHKVLTTSRIEWLRKTKFIAMDFNYERALPKVTCTFKITSAFRGYTTVFDLDIDYQKLQDGSRMVTQIETPVTSPLKVETTYRGERSHFDSGLKVEYANAVLNTELTFRWEREDKVIDFKLLETPLSMEPLEIKLTHHHGDSANNGEMRITYNSIERVDIEFSYNRGMPLRMHVDMKKPLAIEIICNYNDEGSKKTGDLFIKYIGETFTMDMTHETDSGWYTVDEKLVINAILPSGRSMKLDTDVYKSDSELRHKATLQWQRGEQASWDMDLVKEQRRGQDVFDGTLKVMTPAGEAEFTVSKKVMDGKREIEIRGPGSLVVTLTQEYNPENTRYYHVLDVQHSRLNKGIKQEYLSVVDFDNCKVEFRCTLECEDMEGEVYFRIEDESGNRERIVLEQIIKNNFVQLDNYYQTIYINNDREFKMDTIWKFGSRASNGQVNEYVNKISLDKITHYFELEFDRPASYDADVKYIGSIKTKNDEECVYELKRMWKDTEQSIEYGCRPGTCFVELGRKPSRNAQKDLLRFESVYVDVNNMHLRAAHTKNGRDTDDIVLGVESDRRGRVKAKTLFRNELMKELGDYLSRVDFADCVRLIQEELAGTVAHAQQMLVDLGDVMEKVFDTVKMMYREQIDDVIRTWQRMLRENEFYLADIVDFCKTIKDVFARQMQRFFVYVGQMLNYLKTRSDRLIRGVFYAVSDVFDELKTNLIQYINDNWQYVKTMQQFVARVFKALDDLVKAIDEHPLVQWYYNMLDRIKNGDLARAIHAWKMEINQWLEEMEQQYSTQLQILRDIWNNLKRMPFLRHYENAITNIYEHLFTLLDSYDFEEHVRNIAVRLSQITWAQIKEDIMHWIGSMINSWDPDNLALDMDIYFPEAFLWDIQGLPNLDIAGHFASFSQWMKTLMPEDGWTLSDYYHYYMSVIRSEGLLPPSKAKAVLVGTQHYVTFDGKFFEYASECSHLLARDFVNRLFAVVVNYKRENGKLIKTITVSDTQHQVEILPSGEVKKDGRTVELPLLLTDMVVLREKDQVVVKNVHGLGVVCDLTYDTCTVELSIQYFGKTAGLLGTYDNEPMRDAIKSDGSIATDLEDFAGSWAVGNCRRARNIAVVQEPREGTESYTMCGQLFMDRDSPLSKCFMVVNPDKYFKMCLNDLANNDLHADKKLCVAAKQYVNVCLDKKVMVKLPEQCMKCEQVDINREFTGEVTLEGQQVPKKADVIFVIEHAECNGVITENLKDIAEDIQTQMIQRNIDDVKFGVVGYGSEGYLREAHSHTIDSQLVNSVDKLQRAASSIQDQEHGTGEVDPLKAVYFAAQYPFRTGASKTIVLLPCEQCRNTIYYDVKAILQARDIRLHVVLEHEYKLKPEFTRRDTPEFENIYGADVEGVYTRRHVRGNTIQSDQALHAYVEMPQDACSQLSHLSMGTVFDVKQFTEARRNDQKKFLQVMVKVIAEGGIPAECQRCQCVSDVMTGSPVSVCQSCDAGTFDISSLYPDVLKITDGGILDLYLGSN